MKTRKKIGGKLIYSEKNKQWLAEPSEYTHVATYRAAEARLLNLLKIGKIDVKDNDIWQLFVTKHSIIVKEFSSSDLGLQYTIINRLKIAIQERNVGLTSMEPGTTIYTRHEDMIKGEQELLEKLEKINAAAKATTKKSIDEQQSISSKCEGIIQKLGSELETINSDCVLLEQKEKEMVRQLSELRKTIDTKCVQRKKQVITELQSTRDRKSSADTKLVLLTNKPIVDNALELKITPKPKDEGAPKPKDAPKPKEEGAPKPKDEGAPKPKAAPKPKYEGAPKPKAPPKRQSDEDIFAEFIKQDQTSQPRVLSPKGNSQPENIQGFINVMTTDAQSKNDPALFLKVRNYLEENRGKLPVEFYAPYNTGLLSYVSKFSFEKPDAKRALSIQKFIDNESDKASVADNAIILQRKKDAAEFKKLIQTKTPDLFSKSKIITALLSLKFIADGSTELDEYVFDFLKELLKLDKDTLCTDDRIFECIQAICVYSTLRTDTFIEFLYKYVSCDSPRNLKIIHSWGLNIMQLLPTTIEFEQKINKLLTIVGIDNANRIKYIQIMKQFNDTYKQADENKQIDDRCDVLVELGKIIKLPYVNKDMKSEFIHEISSLLTHISNTSYFTANVYKFLIYVVQAHTDIFSREQLLELSDLITQVAKAISAPTGATEASATGATETDKTPDGGTRKNKHKKSRKNYNSR
jgi:hypothetical protein